MLPRSQYDYSSQAINDFEDLKQHPSVDGACSKSSSSHQSFVFRLLKSLLSGMAIVMRLLIGSLVTCFFRISMILFSLLAACLCNRFADDEHDMFDYDTSSVGLSSRCCSIGTGEVHGVWVNDAERSGMVTACVVWLLMLYSGIVFTFLSKTEGISPVYSLVYNSLCFMALACHAKTSLTDPGATPKLACATDADHLALENCRKNSRTSSHAFKCNKCDAYKPPLSHHCRICNRCISRMDHHCPWMNNCIGAGNMKFFILFLLYTWLANGVALTVLSTNYYFCDSSKCEFNQVLIQLVRVMTLLSMAFFLFVSNMLMSVAFGFITGIGTIDRMKKKAAGTQNLADDEPMRAEDIFGIGPLILWAFPVDPVFADHSRVMGWTTAEDQW